MENIRLPKRTAWKANSKSRTMNKVTDLNDRETKEDNDYFGQVIKNIVYIT